MSFSKISPKESIISRHYEIIPIPAFEDNYIWLLHQYGYAIVVDPGDATPVIAYLIQHQLKLIGILVTHYHHDHIGGISALIDFANPQIYASAYESLPYPHISVSDGEKISISEINLSLEVMHIPGHTLGHVAYYNTDFIFCGDTLFAGGCGRIFEGSPEQMLNSLHRIAQLSPNTSVYCTHEYTEKNLAFALSLEPSNQDLIHRRKTTHNQRKQAKPSLPSNIGLELKTNPFLRCNQAEIIQSSNASQSDELTVFSKIRMLRNHY